MTSTTGFPRRPLVSFVLAVLTGCAAETHAATDAGEEFDGGSLRDGGTAEDAERRLDAGLAADASDACVPPSCPAPPSGCRWEGGSVCECGTLVCDDAGMPCDFVDTLARGCSADENCVVGVHQTDCCGNTHAYGMNHSERDRFDAAEPLCQASYPPCGCPAGPTRTDSDETTFDPSAVKVACVARGPGGICTTYVDERPIDGR